MIERTDLPDDLIRTVSGEEVFRAEEQRVYPILGFPDRLVGVSSQELVEKHAKEWPSERIFRQVGWTSGVGEVGVEVWGVRGWRRQTSLRDDQSMKSA